MVLSMKVLSRMTVTGSSILSACQQTVPVQVGSLSDHVPSDPHVIEMLPTKL